VKRRIPEPDPSSELEDAGIPDLEDGFPEQLWAQDPQRAPLPGDEPVAVEEFGTTATEQRQGESLDGRLDREEPEATLQAGDEDQPQGRRAGRIVEADEGARPDTEKDAVAYEAGPDVGGYTAEEAAMRGEDEPKWT
jgi:hypothetical protein